MLGLHNILFISPPPSFHHHQPPPHVPSGHQVTNTNDHCDISNNQESWTTTKKFQQDSTSAKRGALNVLEDKDAARPSNGSVQACRDCGNRAKKECEFRRCRTCCKSGGYDCSTHVKSTWVPAARRRERIGCGGGGSSASSSGGGYVGGKRPRENLTMSSNSFSSSNDNAAAAAAFSLDTGSSHQDVSFERSLPGQVHAPAVFRCIRVSAINSAAAEVAYQALVNISGHVFKGFLYDQGIDEKNLFPCISKVHSSERNRDSTSPIVDPSNAFTNSGNQRLLEGNG